MSRDQMPEILSDLADRTQALLADFGLEAEAAEQIGFALADEIAASWGGQPIYIAKGTRFQLSKRDLQIFDEQRALGINGLAKKYKLSVQRVYKIIARIRQERIASRQKTLPFGE
ncbi:hypothetical protein SIID45300_01056 [Candidatus Magnetaquicoccaceae bacterium FCR-1]|uniref:Mor transcription activator domain-containing protein n=1 Tax=Candidatus Magnetaquiglobus chichijimensis TaxID=3141448 RepID=A0ABQ0C784_9PROT